MHVARTATGEIKDAPDNDGKGRAALASGKTDRAAWAANMTPERQTETAPGRRLRGEV